MDSRAREPDRGTSLGSEKHGVQSIDLMRPIEGVDQLARAATRAWNAANSLRIAGAL